MTHDEKMAMPSEQSLSAEIDAYFRAVPEGTDDKISRESETYRVEKQVRALRKSGKADEAMALVWKSLANGEASPLLWLEAATTLSGLNRHGEALAAIDRLLETAASSAQVWALLGQILAKHGKNPAAEPSFRRALRLDPTHKTARLWLAQWLAQMARYEQSAEQFSEVRALDPDSLDAQAGLAQVMISQGRVAEAAPMLDAVLAKKDDHLDARLGAARGALLRGDFAAGWPGYEWRRKRADLKMPKITGPEWDGSPISGKTIVVYAEQGFGDVLQFLRYIPLMAAEGARVVLLIPKELERLCQCMADHAEIRCTLSSLPAFDYHVPLLSVPQFFLDRLDAIPAVVPYIDVPPNPRQKLPIPFGTRLKVGLVWAGRPTHANDRHRSQKIELFLPLAGIPGVTFYALQAGPRTQDIHKSAHPALVGDLSPHLKDFADTANVIKQLDLVIAVDTSVAHLAGALGKPVWVLIPFAPDWRWMLDEETTPWYPTMRLLRQTSSEGWDDIIERIGRDLRGLVAGRPEAGTVGECRFVSLFADAEGKPRYRMRTPASFLTDPGIRYLIERERAGIGYEYATRSFLDAHLEPGDLFIDVGAHWGVMSLHAATHAQGGVRVLACEPTPRNIPHLRQWIDDNGLGDSIELIGAAISDRPGRGAMLPQSTMGHSLEKDGDGAVEVTTIDTLLAARPDLRGRRVIVKIDVEGTEADVIAGMEGLLVEGRVAAIIWERGRTYDAPANRGLVERIRERLSALGFTPWRFDAEDKAGPLRPFVDDGRIDNVFELAPSMQPAQAYGLVRPEPPKQPEDPILDQAQQAAAQFQKGLKLQASGAIDKALSAYAVAATLDRRNPDLYNNLGVALQRLGRLPAAEAAYRLGLHHGAGLGCLSNLGSVLREQGRLEEAHLTHRKVLNASPDQARWLVNAGHAASDLGHAAEAQALYEKALAQDPDNAELQRDLADSLLRQGDRKGGFARYDSYHARRASAAEGLPPDWTGDKLAGRTVLVEHDGDIEDAVLFARFLPRLRSLGAGRVIVRAADEAMRLMALMDGVDQSPPIGAVAADCRVRLTALPVLAAGKRTDGEDRRLYLTRAESPPKSVDRRVRLGLAWANTLARKGVSLSLAQLLPLLDDPCYAAFALQRGVRAQDVASLAAGLLVREEDPVPEDPADLAAAIGRMDVVLTADPLVAHLAGAAGVPTLAILPPAADWRWQADQAGRSVWYPAIRLWHLPREGLRDSALPELAAILAELSSPIRA